MLLKYDLIAGSYPNEVRKRQIRRLAEHDVSNWEYHVTMTAVSRDDVDRAVDAICELLGLDDTLVAAAAVARNFPEFEQIEPAMRDPAGIAPEKSRSHTD